jgi:hypothetical protein
MVQLREFAVSLLVAPRLAVIGARRYKRRHLRKTLLSGTDHGH